MDSKSSEQKFLDRLYDAAEKKGGISKQGIIEIAKEIRYAPAIKILLDEKEEKFSRISPEAQRLGISPDGSWKTIDELMMLGTGYSERELSARLESAKGIFPQKKDKVFGQMYWIEAEHVLKLPKPGSGVSWPSRYKDYATLYQEIVELRSYLGDMTSSQSNDSLESRTAHLGFPVHVPKSTHRFTKLEGVRMTIPELAAAGSTYNLIYLSQKIKKCPEQFSAEKLPQKGKPWSVLVTEKNYKLLGLPSLPGQTASPTNSTKKQMPLEERLVKPKIEVVKINIQGKEREFNPHEKYPAQEVGRLLMQVHSLVFNENGIKQALNYLGMKEGEVEGSRLISFLNEINGMMIISSTTTQKKLGDLLGGEFEQVANRIGEYKLQHFIHNHPAIDQPYIKQDEIPLMRATIELAQRGPIPANTLPPKDNKPIGKNTVEQPIRRNSSFQPTNSVGQIMREYHSRWVKEGIMPPSFHYRILQDERILRGDNLTDLDVTYFAYEQAMKGWHFVDLRMVSDKLRIPIGQFLDQFSSILKSKNLAKDLAQELRGHNGGKTILVFADKKEKEIARVIKEKYSVDIEEVFRSQSS